MNLFAILRNRRRKGGKLTVAFVEVHTDVDFFQSVDLVVCAWTEVFLSELDDAVSEAVARSITFRVETVLVGGVARVRRRLESLLVCLHEIKLWAVVTSNCVGIAVVLTLFSRIVAAIREAAWHRDCVESCDASTSTLTDVCVKLYESAEQLWLEVGLGVGCLF